MAETLEIQPTDEHNQKLVSNVHPPQWTNPTPDSRYNLVVIGAGSAGLITAAGAAGLGAKVALVERHLLGGDCLNVGCVPSKALIRAARAYADVRDAGSFGVQVPGDVTVDFPKVMERMRRLRAQISPNDSASRYQNELGVDVYLGQAVFTASDTVMVGEQELKFAKAVIATGGRAAEPSIPGLKEAGFLTNETVFSLTDLPKRMAVIGAGPIGCELAQAFARFGSQVTLLGNHPQIMPKEDPAAAKIVQEAMAHDGINLILGCKVTKVDHNGNEKILTVECEGGEQQVQADAILVGVGRAPNVEGLGLEKVGVDFDRKHGIKVNDTLRTTNKKIYAAGDICSKYKFTHMADALARIVIRNALFFGRKKKASDLVVPWTTYTDPEVAHVGLYESDAKKQGIEIDTYEQPFEDLDRAILDGATNGFVKVHTKKGKDTILGATIVAPHAGEMISEITLAMTTGSGLGSLAETIHPYPTQAEGIKRVADAYNRTRLTPFVKKLFEKWLAWTR